MHEIDKGGLGSFETASFVPLVPDVPEGTPEYFKSIAAQIESTSGVFCKPVYEAYGHLVSNDRGMSNLIPELRERTQQSPASGIGLFVGSGNIVSLLPNLGIDLPIVLDKNTAVLEFTSALNQIIDEQSEDLSKLGDKFLVCRYASQKLCEQLDWGDNNAGPSPLYGAAFIERNLLSEARRYGPGHWSHPERLERASGALREKPPVYVAADLMNEDFAVALSAICKQQGKLITFANLTNIHEWIRGCDMSFLRALPFDPNVTIVFSTNGETPLEATIASSLEDYIQRAGSSWANLTKDAAWVYEY